MQDVYLPGQEVIVYPFLSWSSIASRTERMAVLNSVQRNLAPGGRFIIHEASMVKRRTFLSSSREPVVKGYVVGDGSIHRRFFSVPFTDHYFVNFHEFMAEPSGPVLERYFMPIPLVDDGELAASCGRLGLALEGTLDRFPEGTGENMSGTIYTFRRAAE
jgi:hypothetical protein